MNNRFCENPRCDLHVNVDSNMMELEFPIPVRNHLEWKKVKRVRIGKSWYCYRCAGVLEHEIEKRKGRTS